MLKCINPKSSYNGIKTHKDIFNYIYINYPFENDLKKSIKITEKNFKIPTIKEYNHISIYNYTLPMLKLICKHYNISKTGNKHELSKKIYFFLYSTHSIIKIQRFFRIFLKYKLHILHGPAFIDKNKCVNDTDFLTMEQLKDIPHAQFYSFKDIDNMIYGFDISSILNAINKDNHFRNPYNRKALPLSKIMNDIHSIMRLNIILKLNNENNENTNEDNTFNLPIHKQIQLKFLSICQKLDELGNYTDVNWFNNLSAIKIIKFLHELQDIWIYRAQLSIATKQEICPEGDPFNGYLYHYGENILTIEDLKIKMIKIVEKFIYKGINNNAQILGASYILSALTLVNDNAAQAMPWFYFSVAHVN
jgi:hypothetical protein